MMRRNSISPGVAGRRSASALGISMAAFATCIVCATATAAPQGELSVFGDCPLGNAAVTGCLTATVGGNFAIGDKQMPISSPIVLQAGFVSSEETEAVTIVGAADGATLSKSPQVIPGGLASILPLSGLPHSVRTLLKRFSRHGLGEATATIELAAPASAIELNEGNIFAETGTALSLPVKIHLANPLLGRACYVGSEARPILLALTTGTTSPPPPNEPINGAFTGFEVADEGMIAVVSETLVNNSFAVPRADGCGGVLSFILDPLIDAGIGLPSAAGHNSTVLNAVLKQANAEAVRTSE